MLWVHGFRLRDWVKFVFLSLNIESLNVRFHLKPQAFGYMRVSNVVVLLLKSYNLCLDSTSAQHHSYPTYMDMFSRYYGAVLLHCTFTQFFLDSVY